jgi:hypothetical protein
VNYLAVFTDSPTPKPKTLRCNQVKTKIVPRMPRKRNEDIGLIILIAVVGLALLWVYAIKPFTIWVSQNWILVIIAVGLVASIGITVYFKVIQPVNREVDEEYRKKEELKKSILRKRILQEKTAELDSLNLTNEEREFQIIQWVEEAYNKEFVGGYSKSLDVANSRFDRVPPLSQREKELIISKVGTRCCYPSCEQSIGLEVHHIIPRSEGGTNKENNLVVLCPNHHHLADRTAIPRERLKMYSVARMKFNSY